MPDQPTARPPDRAAKARGEDDIVVLEGATWADFERVCEIRGERPVPRLAFHDGQLQLMAPSPHHEVRKSILGCLLEAYCFEREIDITPYGAWMLKNRAREAGLEPDECYVLGDDPEAAERPDLAIEVVWTSGGIDKLAIYRALGVREVWFWTHDGLELYALGADGYAPIDRSQAFPGLDLELLASFIDTRPMTRAVRAYRARLREPV